MLDPVIEHKLAVYNGLREIDDRLAESKERWHRMSPWWWSIVETVYLSPVHKPQVVIRCGRRGGKSSSICRIQVAEALYGLYKIQPGDVGTVPIISVDRDEAKSRLFTIEEMLKSLGFKAVRDAPKHEGEYTASGNSITILRRIRPDEEPTTIAFKVQTASIGGVVGATRISAICDEAARWKDSSTGSNPAAQVIASLKPGMTAIPSAILWLISSALSTLDYHYEQYELGNTKHQWTFGAPTWIANPSITEERTHDLEPDPVLWAREYGNIPSTAEETSFLDSQIVDEAVGRFSIQGRRVAGADFGFTKNSTALVPITTDGERFSTAVAFEWVPFPGLPLRPSETIRSAARICVELGVEGVGCDSHYQESVAEVFDAIGIARLPAPTEVFEAWKDFRIDLCAGRVSLPSLSTPEAKLLVRQLKQVRVRPSGDSFTIVLPEEGRRHCDLAAALVVGHYWAKRTGNDAVIRGGARKDALGANERLSMSGEDFAAWDDRR